MIDENRTDARHDGTRNRRRLIVIVVTAALLVPAVILILTAQKANNRIQAAIQKQLDAIRAAGEPVTAEDLARLYPDPPPEHDALRLLQPSMDKVRIPAMAVNLPVIGDLRQPRGMPFSEATLADMNEFLARNSNALAVFPATGLEGAWFGCGYPGSFTNGLPFRLASVLNLEKVLCVQAVAEAEAGRGAMAAQALERGMAVAGTLQCGPLVHHLARLVAEDRICAALELTVNRIQLSDAELLALQTALTNNSPAGFQRALVVMRCHHIRGMEICRQSPERAVLSGFRSPTLLQRIVSWFTRASGKAYRDADFLLLLEWDRDRIQAMTLPPRERLDRLRQLNPTKPDMTKYSRALSIVDGSGNDYAGRAQRDVENVTRMRVASVALAVERWRLAHEGRLPDSLTQLVPGFLPSVPVDPFDGQPLRYRKLVRGFAVYSVGADFTDNGGVVKPFEAGGQAPGPDDIVFAVER